MAVVWQGGVKNYKIFDQEKSPANSHWPSVSWTTTGPHHLQNQTGGQTWKSPTGNCSDYFWQYNIEIKRLPSTLSWTPSHEITRGERIYAFFFLCPQSTCGLKTPMSSPEPLWGYKGDRPWRGPTEEGLLLEHNIWSSFLKKRTTTRVCHSISNDPPNFSEGCQPAQPWDIQNHEDIRASTPGQLFFISATLTPVMWESTPKSSGFSSTSRTHCCLLLFLICQ